ncbi:hypothetical protein D3C86_1518180 [compost metagenome]
MRVGCMTCYPGQRCKASTLGFRQAHQHEGSRAIRNRTGVRRSHRPAFAKRRFQRRNFVDPGLTRLFIAFNRNRLTARRSQHRDNLVLETPFGDCLLSSGQRADRKLILLASSESITLSTVFGVCAHEPAFLVGIFQPIEKHMINDFAVAHSIA